MTKSTRPIIRIHNLETNEIIDREMNDDEFAQYEITKSLIKTEQAETQAKAAEKQALLDRLGITADEAKLLLG